MASDKPRSEISLVPATEADFVAAINLQYLSFDESVLIEYISNPDTPENRVKMLETHRRHLRDNEGLRLIKAVARTDDAGPEKDELVGFCMFYLPTPSPTEPGAWILPTVLPTTFDETFQDSVPNTTPAPAVTAATVNTLSTSNPDPVPPVPPLIAPADPATTGRAEGPISVSRTNIPELRVHRLDNLISHVNNLRKTDPSAAFPPPIAYVRYMCVHPSWRRHGIGRRLMDWRCNLFDELGFDAALSASTAGEALYRHYGFESLGEQVLEVDGVEAQRYANMWRDAKWRREKKRSV